MESVPKPKLVELEGAYYHVRFRDPDEFVDIRTPIWASNAASSISEGCRVRTGRRKGTDEWVVQSILIPKHVGKAWAQSQAVSIINKIEG